MEKNNDMEDYMEEMLKRKNRVYEEIEKALRKVMGQMYYDKIIENPEWIKNMVCEKTYNDIENYVGKKGKQRWKYVMWTINPRPGTDFDLIKKYTEKCVKKKWIVNWMYCYETRGTEDSIHVHIKTQVDDDKSIYHCKREVYNTFKNIVNNIQCVNKRYSNRDGCFDEYIKGIKDGDKKEHWEFDEVFRNKFELKKYYKSGDKI